jgi:hypothetical protein
VTWIAQPVSASSSPLRKKQEDRVIDGAKVVGSSGFDVVQFDNLESLRI